MILMPGLVEGHAHAMEGSLWRHTYCGYFDRVDPNGRTCAGAKSLEAVLDRLKRADADLTDPTAALPGWQLDPIYFGNQRLTRHDLDKVSTTRPIGVLHASGHIANVNSRALQLAGLLRPGIEHPGVPLGKDGLPLGELRGPDVLAPIAEHTGFDSGMLDCDEPGLRNFAKLCVRAGITTVTDLAAQLTEPTVQMMLRVTDEPRFPVRVVPLRYFLGMTPQDLIDHAASLRAHSTDRLRLGRIKVVADGSIQGFTARLRWPGYYNGAENGLWYITPPQLQQVLALAIRNDLQVHIHANGDEATDLVLDTMETVLKAHPAPDHRTTIQHCQMADAAQFRRMARLGLGVNLFANHHFYWGDEHYDLTLGPDRAERMNACATALQHGVPMSIHSDAPITPLGPMFTAWCAVNRQTASGRVLGEAEKISVSQALYAITMGAAQTLGMESEIGSIEVGKRADFAVLQDDPTEIGADRLRDVRVWGTVQGDRIFAADEQI
ncbi:amidohydrolase [Sedimentitalea sp. HM32M-2]|uniref:amidohydrolase n=1 Tax=Sedimentitalea sp. HM32M-2 TaxID=3351566 RepID=UPI00363D82F8